MKKTRSLCLYTAALIVALLAAGCGGTATKGTQATPTVGVSPTGAAPTASGTDYPAPVDQPTEGYAAPADPNSGLPTSYPQPAQASGLGSVFPTQTGDAGLARGNFFVDSAKLQPSNDQPGAFDVLVTGSLPTPCNTPRAEVSGPDGQNKITVTLYSLVQTDKMCAEVIQPFDGPVATLGGYPAGKYTVVVNDKPAGEMTIP